MFLRRRHRDFNQSKSQNLCVAPLVGPVRVFEHDQRHARSVDQHFSGMLEIDGDALADHRLNLADAPVGLLRMLDQHARHQFLCH